MNNQTAEGYLLKKELSGDDMNNYGVWDMVVKAMEEYAIIFAIEQLEELKKKYGLPDIYYGVQSEIDITLQQLKSKL